MAISLSFGIFKKFGKQKVIREGHEASTRVEGAPPVSWAPRVPPGLRFHARYVFWLVKIHYIYSRRLYNRFLPTKIRNIQENGVREAHEVPTRQGARPPLLWEPRAPFGLLLSS